MSRSSPSRPTADVIAELSERVRQIEGVRRPVGDEAVISSGQRALDRLLPEGGVRRGSLVEWLSGTSGSGAGTLALLVAREAAEQGGAVVVIDRARRFYPPAAAGWGIDLARLIVVRPGDEADHAWALDQVLRCRGVAAVWTCPPGQDEHAQRRWQLAAESSGVVGLLLRGAAARHEPSWADLRLLVEPIAEPTRRQAGCNRRLRVKLLRCRAGRSGGVVELEIGPRGDRFEQHETRTTNRERIDETRSVHLASQLAPATAGRQPRSA
jgi:protein ImuA